MCIRDRLRRALGRTSANAGRARGSERGWCSRGRWRSRSSARRRRRPCGAAALRARFSLFESGR
eukprot:15141468-Alexandrium_andersonii.AAC.1